MRVRTTHVGRLASVLLLSSLLSACASNAPSRPPQRAADSTAMQPGPGEEPRSQRGNPPFYDVLGKRYHVMQTSAAARALTPEVMWTTVPPAKSSAPRFLIQPPIPQTQWATGL